MATTGVIRAWYNIGSQYIYWNVTQIANPLADYPGGGYPAAALLSDFVLLDYNDVDGYANNGSEIYLPWGFGVLEGYAVYASDNAGLPEALNGIAVAYNTSEIVGVASSTTDYVTTTGETQVYCDGTANPGDSLYLSPSATGAVTATPPVTQSLVLCFVGTAIELKVDPGVSLITIDLDPRTPILFEQTAVPLPP
jgi:hypothetical protein